MEGMKEYVKITKSQVKLPTGLAIPAGNEKRVFIPAFGKDNNGYYYLVDYKEKTITCWTINNEKIKLISTGTRILIIFLIIFWRHILLTFTKTKFMLRRCAVIISLSSI